MDFATPTSQENMYEILDDIFYYYRLQNKEFVEVDLTEYYPNRLTPETYDNSALEQYVRTIKTPTFFSRKLDAEKEYKDNVFKQMESKSKLISKKSDLLYQIDLSYKNAIDDLNKTALKNGAGREGVYTEKKAELIAEREQKKAEVIANLNAEEKAIEENIKLLNQNYQSLINGYTALDDYEVQAKLLECFFKQKEFQIEVFKYNNSIDEKLFRSKTANETLNANLRIKYAELSAKGFTKDQLVDMGYYEDAIKCVSSYYDTLPANEAFSKISSDNRLIVYLDDYYQTVVYMYKLRVE